MNCPQCGGEADADGFVNPYAVGSQFRDPAGPRR